MADGNRAVAGAQPHGRTALANRRIQRRLALIARARRLGLTGKHDRTERLLTTSPFRALAPLAILTFPVRDLYPPTHWALRGEPPALDTPDEDVYLPGRNIILLSKAGIYCAQQNITRLAIGPLAGNPFPDATPEFFSAMTRALLSVTPPGENGTTMRTPFTR